jgi:hypothetical protein
MRCAGLFLLSFLSGCLLFAPIKGIGPAGSHEENDPNMLDHQPKPGVIAPSTGCAFASDDPLGPALFFTDISSGPHHGGEGDLGVMVSLYGLRFGQNAADLRVTLGGTDVARIVALNPSPADAARGLEVVTVQLGSAVSSGDLVVTVNGRSSNPLPFVVREGNIFFVDPSVASDGDGSFARPFKTLSRARRPAVMRGDVVYLKGGTYDAFDPSTEVPNHRSNFLLTRLNADTGTSALPIAYVGYPGAPPTVGGNGPSASSDLAIAFPDTTGAPAYYTFANLRFVRTATRGSIRATGIRFIANVFRETSGFDLGAEGVRLNSTWYGNLFDASPDVPLAFYTPSVGVEVGWNELRSTNATGIEIRAQSITDTRIHNNLITDHRGLGLMMVGDLTQTTASLEVFNNVFVVPPTAGILMLFLSGIPPSATLDLSNNTLCCSTSVGTDAVAHTGSFLLRNNIFYTNGTYSAFHASGPDAGIAVFDHNLYFGSAADDTGDMNAVRGDPMLRDLGDPFAVDPRIEAASPARGAGVDTGHCADYFGVRRNHAAAYDLGAAAYVP